MAAHSIFQRNIYALLAGAAVSACSHTPPGLANGDVPTHWEGKAASNAIDPAPYWWEEFRSSELSRLLAQAQTSNFEMQAAALHIIEAKARAESVGTNLWPSADVSASASRRGDYSSSPRSNSFSASFGISYEADLWGRLSANNRSALAALDVSRYDRDTVALTVSSGVANAYLDILALRDRLKTARADLDIAEQVLKIVEARERAGVVPPLDLEQQRAAVAQQRATIPPLEQQERATRASLALLLGQSATGFTVDGRTLDAIAIPSVAPGMPSELLNRRPDIASAQASLRGSSAALDAARASLLPSIGLSGSTGIGSAALKNLLNPASAAWSIGASIGQAIFDGGARDASLKGARAQEQEALLSYRKVVLTAFSEVDLALSNIAALAEQRASREIQIAAAREAYRIAQVRYKAGVDDLEALLQSQSSLFSAEDSLSQIKLAQAEAAITLFRALGGGWQKEQRDAAG